MEKLGSLIGLIREKEKARLLIKSCSVSGELFPHTLLHSIGGLGKTEFARRVGSELECHFVETHAAAFKRTEVLFSSLVEGRMMTFTLFTAGCLKTDYY